MTALGGRRVVAATGLAVVPLLVILSLAVGVPSAHAIPPFPIVDDTAGEPGTTNPNWDSIVSGTGSTGNTYTSDNWLRLTNAGTNQSTNILNDVAFPSSTGFVVDFDYRQAGGISHTGDSLPARTGDGMAMYLVDGSSSVTAGGFGGGLGYAGNEVTCGVTGGYMGVGFDIYGNYAVPRPNSVGGPGVSPSGIGVRGSGTQPCTDPSIANYPWVGGATVPDLWTGVAGDRTDPALDPASLYRHVRVRVSPVGNSVQVSVAISGLTPKSQPHGALVGVLDVNLDTTPGQAPLPETLKLGFSASTGGATDYHDIRAIKVSAYTDAELSKSLAPATPGNPVLGPGRFLPGDAVEFLITASNAGPSIIGDPPTGTARVFDDLSSLPLTDVSWTCDPSPGAICASASGTGPVVSVDWAAPAGGSVVVTVMAIVALGAPAGTYSNTALIPTDFESNTVGESGDPVQRDNGVVDSDTSNNASSVSFTVDRPNFTQVKSSDASAYAVGQTVTYTVAVANDGTAPGTAAIDDAVPPAIAVTSATCTVAGVGTCSSDTAGNNVSATVTLWPDATAELTITGVATTVGSADNTAVITPSNLFCAADCGGGSAITEASVVNTSLSLAKTVQSDGMPITLLTVGQTVTFEYEITNSGQFALEDLHIDELSFTGAGVLDAPVCTASALDPGELTTCRSSYTVLQQDVDAGTLENSARAVGRATASTAEVISNVATARLTVPPAPALFLTKVGHVTDANDTALTDAGDVITWTLVAENTGNITLQELAVEDSTAGAVTCEATRLLPGQATVCTTAPHTITNREARAGAVVNQATATATDARGVTVTSNTATATVPVAAPGPGQLAGTGAALPPMMFAAAGCIFLGWLLRRHARAGAIDVPRWRETPDVTRRRGRERG
ncbi:DUF7507 domain-containing protein [Microbacterium sp. CPCC 204701]|uniref:DUF7507 domain-containing protein n=1 Tax=Microbacterium sp. CPCC 204701 TaxID=2493084 RepID=UPI0013E3359E|nr:DUF11 domain-containing protein [Microbacterium sp. CPCC 204701]